MECLVFLVLSFISSLSVFDSNPLSDGSANTFSHFVGCIFIALCFKDFKGQGTDLCFLTLLLDNEWCSPSLLNEKAKCTRTHVLCVYGVCMCVVYVQCVCVVCVVCTCVLCVWMWYINVFSVYMYEICVCMYNVWVVCVYVCGVCGVC